MLSFILSETLCYNHYFELCKKHQVSKKKAVMQKYEKSNLSNKIFMKVDFLSNDNIVKW